MFTGLVEEIGSVVNVIEDSGLQLEIACIHVLSGLILGDSIAVNGVCLTVTSFTNKSFTVGLAPETRRLTNLGKCKIGTKVNLERSVTPSTRMGGHFVQGHVDATGRIKSVVKDGDSLVFEIEAHPTLLRYIVKKGYITVDGASLTVIACDSSCFKFMLIQYTQQKIVTAKKQVGDLVNLEVDILGKYIEKFMYLQEKPPAILQEYKSNFASKL